MYAIHKRYSGSRSAILLFLASCIVLEVIIGANLNAAPQSDHVVDLRFPPRSPSDGSPLEIRVAIDTSAVLGRQSDLPLDVWMESAQILDCGSRCEAPGPNRRALEVEVRIRNTGPTPFLLPIHLPTPEESRSPVSTLVRSKGGRSLTLDLIIKTATSTSNRTMVITHGSETYGGRLLPLLPGDSAILQTRWEFNLHPKLQEMELRSEIIMYKYLDDADVQTMIESSNRIRSGNAIRVTVP